MRRIRRVTPTDDEVAHRYCVARWADGVRGSTAAAEFARWRDRRDARTQAATLRDFAAQVRAAHPADVFRPPTRHQWATIATAMRRSGVDLDTLLAEMMRRAAQLADDTADQIERDLP